MPGCIQGLPMIRFIGACTASLAIIAICASVASAEEKSVETLRDIPAFFALPVELDVDRGAANGNAAILRIQPLYKFPLGKNMELANLTILTFADAPGTPAFPGAPGAGKTTGVADLLHASFFTPKSSGNVVWGVGPIVSLPTATDEALGSEKWSIGPALRFAYRTEQWNLGFIAGQRWSFAGTGSRNDVNQLLFRGAIRRELAKDWYFVSAPLITANWERPGRDWLIPVGGGIGRTFDIGRFPWAWSVQGYYNVVKADPDPDWVVRFAIIPAIPFGN
jgi:hypothetical protein